MSDTQRATGGVIVRLPHQWVAGADYVWGHSKTASVGFMVLVGDPDGTGPNPSITTALGNGTLNVMRDLNLYPLDYTPYVMPKNVPDSDPYELISQSTTLRASGPLVHLPGGALTLSGSGEWRGEEIQGTVYETLSAASPASTFGWYPPVKMKSASYYLEMRAPLFSDRNAIRLIQGLELQASVRRDDYEARTRVDVNPFSLPSRDGPFPEAAYFTRKLDATKYTVGMKYSPIEDIALRVSAGSGFLPPSLSQLGASNTFTSSFSVIDPKRGNVNATVSNVTILQGGSPDLLPEESESVSAGLIITPRFVPGFRLSIDYTRIRKTDEIATLTPQLQLNFEDEIPGRVQRLPLTAPDQARGYTAGVITGFNNRSLNFASREITAYDIQGDYTFSTSAGDFHAYTLASYQTKLASQTIPGAALVNSIGYQGPLKLKGNVGLDWNRGPWSLGWNMQYYDSYYGYSPTASAASIAAFILNQGVPRIPSQNYHDLILGYRVGAEAKGWLSLLADSTLSFGVQNILNTYPPAVATTGTFPSYSTYGDARLRRYQINIRKHF